MTLITGNMITLLPILWIIILIKIDPVMHKNITKYYVYALMLCALESILEIVTIVNTVSSPFAALISQLANAIGFALAPLLGFFMLCIVISDTKLEKYKIFFNIPIMINALFSFLSIKYGFIFYVTPNNEYMRGPLFYAQLIMNLAYIILFIILDLTKKKKYIHIDYVCICFNYLFAIAALIMQIIYPKLLLIWGSISLCLIFYYIHYQNMLLWRDPLTSLLNRRMYEKTLQTYSHKTSVTIINIDLNFFKLINDTCGHVFGDKVLSTCANILHHHFKDFGFTFRIGGDEFCILCKNIDINIIDTIFTSMENELISIKEQVHMSKLLSYGYCVYIPEKYTSIYEAVKIADSYMYTYKKIHKSCNYDFLAISEFLK